MRAASPPEEKNLSAQLRLWITNSGVQLRVLWRSLKYKVTPPEDKFERLVSPLEDKTERTASPLGDKFERAVSPPEDKLERATSPLEDKTERAASPLEDNFERAAAPPLATIWKPFFRDIEKRNSVFPHRSQNGIPFSETEFLLFFRHIEHQNSVFRTHR